MKAPNRKPPNHLVLKGRKVLPKDGLTENEQATLRSLLAELARREIEALKLYRPMPKQAEFHKSKTKERVIRGGNRSGKTTAACVEVAYAVTNQDPYKKYPEKGVWYMVGKDGREVANVLAKKLLRAGAFKIVRDKETQQWRSFNPVTDDPKEAKPAPPLIPQRFIKSIAWEDKKLGWPKKIDLTTGWELHFFSSEGKPPHGVNIHGASFDEEIVNGEWYSEIAARLVDEDGFFIWSATPQAGNEQLFELHERADRQLALPQDMRKVEEYIITLDDNIHLTQQQKDDFASKLSEEERIVRVKGEFAFMPLRVYPEYSTIVHECDPFMVPADWTRYAAIDPGRQVCAVLFMAIPRKEEYAYVYDELYITNCDAELFGQGMREKCQGQNFEAFIIDNQEARKTDTGSGRTIEDWYAYALKKNGVKSRRTGNRFEIGSASPRDGVEAVRLWLRPRESYEHPRLRIFSGKCPNLTEEVKRYRYKREKRPDGTFKITDKPDDRCQCHVLDCLRYLVQADPCWVSPERYTRESAVLNMLRKKQERQHKGERGYINLGPRTVGA